MRQSTPDHQLLLCPTIDLFSSLKQSGIRLSSAEKKRVGRKVDFRPEIDLKQCILVRYRKEDVVRSYNL
jgi:hypothetical protein